MHDACRMLLQDCKQPLLILHLACRVVVAVSPAMIAAHETDKIDTYVVSNDGHT